MAKQTVDIGTYANDGTGDSLRTAFDKINDNFTELYDGAGGSGNTGQFTFATNTVTVAGTDMNLRTTRTGFDVDADVDILAADDVFIEAVGDEVGISAANEVTITTSVSNMYPTNWLGQEDAFDGTWNGTTLTLTVPNAETTLITLLDYYTNLGNTGNIWLKTASGYVQTENTDPADKTIGGSETVFEIPLLASSPVANADIIRMKLYDSINGDPDKQWSFRKNGKLEFPNGGTIEPVGMGWIGLTNGITGTPVSLINKHTDGDERSSITLGGGNVSGSINLVVVNTAGTPDVYHNWEFNDDGSLTLPGGGTVSEGYVTSNPTIQLTPDAATVASQKLVIKGGGNYSNTENGITVTVNNLTQIAGDSLNVYVESVANANQTLYWWTYPSSANSGVGGTVVIDEFGDGDFTFTLDNDDYEFRVRVSPENDNYAAGVIGAQSVLINPDEPTFNADNHLHLTTGDLTETSIFLGTDDHNVRTTVNGGIQITTPNTSNKVWTFGTDGILQLPNEGKLRSNSRDWEFGANGVMYLPIVPTYVSITYTSVAVTYGGTQLTFTVLPNNTITNMSVAVGSGGYGADNQELTVAGTLFPGGTSPANDITFNVTTFPVPDFPSETTTSSVVTYVSGTLPTKYDNIRNSGNIGIGAGSQHWVFGADGALTFPDFTVQTTGIVQGQADFVMDGTNTDTSLTEVNFNVLLAGPDIGYSGSDTHSITIPNGTPGQRLVVVNNSSLCTVEINTHDVPPVGRAEFIFTSGGFGDGWIPLYGTVSPT